jgi:hypothetical protein
MKSLHKKLDKVRHNSFISIANRVVHTIRDTIRKHTTSYESNTLAIAVKEQVINEIIR